MKPEYWTVLAVMVVGLALTAGALIHALRNLQVLRKSGTNGARMIVAVQSIRNSSIILTVHVVLISAVAWSGWLPSENGFFHVLLTRNYFAAIASVLLSVASLGDWRDWRRMKRLYGLNQL